MLDGLHLDRKVFEALERWAQQRGIHLQDAIQLALCAFGDGPVVQASQQQLPASSARILAQTPSAERSG